MARQLVNFSKLITNSNYVAAAPSVSAVALNKRYCKFSFNFLFIFIITFFFDIHIHTYFFLYTMIVRLCEIKKKNKINCVVFVTCSVIIYTYTKAGGPA